MAAAAVAVDSRINELVAAAKAKLKENRQIIKDSSHPWTPWALVELLDIPDYNGIPAELILYEAFVIKHKRGGIDVDEEMQFEAGIKTRSKSSSSDKPLDVRYKDKELQYEFVEVTKNGEIFFRNGDKYPVRRRQWVMTHIGSRGKVTAKQMWHFAVECIQPNHLGILACFLKTRNISVRMAKMCRQIRRQHAYILVDVQGMFIVLSCRYSRHVFC